MQTFDPAGYPYTPRFCEENIWHLARLLIEQGQDPRGLQVLFLSNEAMQIVMAEQKEAEPGRLILWDYHVVLLADIDDDTFVFDFDTRLDFPCQAESYFEKSIPVADHIPNRYLPSIRVIPAHSYLDRFYSDRSHMIGHLPEALFPEWSPIHPKKKDRAIAIDQYWDVRQELMDGSVIICRGY
jgi:hypothetical protein